MGRRMTVVTISLVSGTLVFLGVAREGVFSLLSAGPNILTMLTAAVVAVVSVVVVRRIRPVE